MWIEDSGQPLCTCMAGGKHAETDQKIEFCVAWNVPCSGFMGGEDGGLLPVVLTLLFPSFFYKASYRSMEGMAICHHLFYCIFVVSFFLYTFFIYSSVSGVGNYCSFSPEFFVTLFTGGLALVQWRHVPVVWILKHIQPCLVGVSLCYRWIKYVLELKR